MAAAAEISATKSAFQAALDRAWKVRQPAPLPFAFGYQYHGTSDANGNCKPATARLDWWQDMLRAYVKNEAVYRCPSTAKPIV